MRPNGINGLQKVGRDFVLKKRNNFWFFCPIIFTEKNIWENPNIVSLGHQYIFPRPETHGNDASPRDKHLCALGSSIVTPTPPPEIMITFGHRSQGEAGPKSAGQI